MTDTTGTTELHASPGGPQAIKDGCLCPVMDNHNGEGCGYQQDDGSPLYWVTSACPLHGAAPENNREAA